MSNKNRPREALQDVSDNVRELRCKAQLSRGNAVYPGGARVPAWIDQSYVLVKNSPTIVQPYDCNLDNAIAVSREQTCGFNIHHSELDIGSHFDLTP